MTGTSRETCTPDETRVVRAGMCPDCGCLLREGPHGGLAVNWYCINLKCGSGFNDTIFNVERITDASPNRGATT